MLLCWTEPRGLPEKELCTGSADRLTQPLPASEPLLTGSPVYQGWKKCKQRGSVHPGTEHRTSFILSLMLLPDSPVLTSRWLYFEIKKYSPWWWTEVIWKHIPSFNRCPKDKLFQSSLQVGESICLWNLSSYIRKGRDEQRSWARHTIWFTKKDLWRCVTGEMQGRMAAPFSSLIRQTGGFGPCELTCYSWNAHFVPNSWENWG